MERSGATRPSRSGAARLRNNQPVTAAGFGPGGGGGTAGGRGPWRQQPGPPAGGVQWVGGGGGRLRSGAKAGPGAGAEEGVTAALAVVSQFPRSQRLHILFLEVADSHRLNSSLVRCMAARLASLRQQAGGERGAGVALSEKVVEMSTLAGFLSFICFARGCASLAAPGFEALSQPPVFDGSHPVDVAAALAGAAADGSLPVTLPWVLRYLWFLRAAPDPDGLPGRPTLPPYFLSVLAQLAELHTSPLLTPWHEHFGLAALCLRSMLDEFASRMGPDLMAASSASSSAVRRAGAGGLPASLTKLAVSDGMLDGRYCQLCCPMLEHARQLFQEGPSSGAGPAASGGGGAGASHQQRGTRQVKTIRPNCSLVPRSAALHFPGPLLLGSAGQRQDPLKSKLQRSFLEQYSTSSQQVRWDEVGAGPLLSHGKWSSPDCGCGGQVAPLVAA